MDPSLLVSAFFLQNCKFASPKQHEKNVFSSHIPKGNIKGNRLQLGKGCLTLNVVFFSKIYSSFIECYDYYLHYFAINYHFQIGNCLN